MINPRIVYVDDAGTFKDCRPKSICMVVHPKLMLEFRSDSARKAFTFLTSSFVEDHLRHGMPLESSGWRTMSEIVVAEKMPKTEVYGVDGHRGSAYSELLRSGLIEERLFLGVRGRGGRILKTRVACDKEAVKDYLDSEMVKIRTRDAQITFDFLADCFVEDYVRRRVSVENSGWRTRSEIINQASVSRSSVRKRIRVEGPAVSELRKDGLIEAKVIPHERGRGRKVMKVRICYGKEAIRRYIAKRSLS
jgi:hypothetical protein